MTTKEAIDYLITSNRYNVQKESKIIYYTGDDYTVLEEDKKALKKLTDNGYIVIF